MIIDDAIKKKFKKDNKIIRGHLLSHMTDPLFDLFVTYKSSEKIWDDLKKNYDANDTVRKNMLPISELSFIWLTISIMKQVHKYENLIFDVLNKYMKMYEIFQANV